MSLRFTNDFAVFESEVASNFPQQIDGFRRLVAAVKSHDDVGLDAKPESARVVVRTHIRDPLLEDMLFCPVMYYGSAQEHDMEFGQFVIMFKALFLEGFARPFEGVRLILRVLLEKYRSAGGERRMKCGVCRIISNADRASALVLDSGEIVTADHIISSIGAPETERLLTSDNQSRSPGDAMPSSRSEAVDQRSATRASRPQLDSSAGGQPNVGQLSFVETMSILDRQPTELGWGSDTIIFFNDSSRFDYARPSAQVDPRSGVICIPNNFEFGEGRTLPEGILRVTCLANYDQWAGLPEENYRAAKDHWFETVVRSAQRFLPPLSDAGALKKATVATDMFTPRTITKFTGHLGGAIYGAPIKNRQGRTSLSNVYLCGTDQGFLGIVGAMLSGISMANYHVLQKETAAVS
jgi:phytoene dehydrogenase-like protein